MSKTAGIILAAGLSSRMGAFKPLLELDGVSMVRRVVRLMGEAGAEPVIVVTGHRREELEQHLAGSGMIFVHNPDFAATQQLDSLKLALSQVRPDCGRVLVSPADIPLVQRETVKRLLAVEGDFVRPRFGRRAGHPVMMSAKLIPYVLKYTGADGLRGAVRAGGFQVLDVPVDDPAILMDNDTPEDFRRSLAYEGVQL